jgi:hypothetical protein
MSFQTGDVKPKRPAEPFTEAEVNSVLPSHKVRFAYCPRCQKNLEFIVIEPMPASTFGTTIKIHCWTCGAGGERHFPGV